MERTERTAQRNDGTRDTAAGEKSDAAFGIANEWRICGFVPSVLRKESAPPTMPHRSATWPTPPRAETRDAYTQTLSTGEIAVLKVYYDEEDTTTANNGTKREP
ncbi:hypothetical protein niasHT_037727 [Heterodera trifolii]|uniref:Uncharacterized protein n=1 Tax=Heterodera trifolii TaxID=157864 RepID=A0ABD2J7M7_9BILA